MNIRKLIFSTVPTSSLLFVRIALGIVLMAHGAQKLFGFAGGSGIDAFSSYLSTLNFSPPMLFAVLAAGTEFFGGALIIVGLLTRVASIGALITMLVAIVKVHPNAFFTEHFGMEFPLVLALLSAALIIGGGGLWSLDWLVSKTIREDGRSFN